jgi:hypothetical protein
MRGCDVSWRCGSGGAWLWGTLSGGPSDSGVAAADSDRGQGAAAKRDNGWGSDDEFGGPVEDEKGRSSGIEPCSPTWQR